MIPNNAEGIVVFATAAMGFAHGLIERIIPAQQAQEIDVFEADGQSRSELVCILGWLHI
ncbi:hypothetical protein JCM31598_08020 [Desulfonatronum parangueonense]